MPTRQSYYCWMVSLTFRCGCVEYTDTAHVCDVNRGQTCNPWITYRSTDKDCDVHRIEGGLHQTTQTGRRVSPQ
ncbi:hypothetical protein QBC46DRAFT_341314 [Diplogelasinospora grovesii]|uniref:Uncharacterized protein n=1 Tax=Diplogelasinospora grovesii TaxID=303347 RepID=A0AAN6NAC4_9PEZI|nr:hypothetical protein QBC46DRAFT_341314 [Diplogelasinospora grovesii]